MTRIGVVVVNYDSHHLLEQNLPAVDADHPVVVVDNRSTDEERELVRRLAYVRGWCLVEPSDNRGFGAGVNAGAQQAWQLGCDVIVLLNPDARVSRSVIDALGRSVADDPDLVLSPQLVTSDGHPHFSGAQYAMRSGRMRRHPRGSSSTGLLPLVDDEEWHSWLTGAALTVSRDMWRRTGGFSEDYFLYWEDVDFSERCKAVGGRLAVDLSLTGVHDEGGTQGRSGRAKSSTYYEYNCRNRLLFARTWLSGRQRRDWVIRTPQESWQILLRGGRRQIVQRPTVLWSVLRGASRGLVPG